MSKMLVETIVSYKLTYLVDEDNEEYAKDMITCNEDKDEIHQEFLGETICGVHELSNKSYNKFLKKIEMEKKVAEHFILRHDAME